MRNHRFYIPEHFILCTNPNSVPEEDTPRIDEHLISLNSSQHLASVSSTGIRTLPHFESSDGGRFEPDFIYKGCLGRQD